LQLGQKFAALLAEQQAGVLHLAAHAQCWASHCLHLRAAEEKQRRGRTRARKNESASALQPPAA
jgi:hypothetical protein